MNTYLNGALLRHLRTEHRVPANDLARLLGIGSAALARIETNDPTASASVTIRGLTNLANTFDIDPRQLITQPRRPHPQNPHPNRAPAANQSQDNDPHLLAGLLLKIKTQARLRELAGALNWSVPRTLTATITLTDQLGDTGLTVTQRGDLIQLSATLTGDAETAHVRIQTASIHTNGMSPATARTLYRVHQGCYRRSGRTSANTRATLSMLAHLGALDLQQGVKPSAALRYALDV